MSTGSYTQARAEASETMRLYAGVSEANHRLLEHLGRREHEVGSAESAVATRLVTLLTQGVEAPSNRALPIVLAPNGRRIAVTSERVEHTGLFACFVASPQSKDWDEVALVVFQQGRPQAVHIIDKERIPLVAHTLDVGVAGNLSGWKPYGIALSVLFHSNVMLEPLVADASGVRTFVLDESASVGWTRLEGVFA